MHWINYWNLSSSITASWCKNAAADCTVGVSGCQRKGWWDIPLLWFVKITLEANKCNLASGVWMWMWMGCQFKSSSTQFWPILGVIKNLPQHQPFVIRLFCGTSKPWKIFRLMCWSWRRDSHSKESPWGSNCPSFVCDAPAWAFVKNVKWHSGYSGYEKCMQEGEYVSNRVIFPQTDDRLSTGKDFREMADEGHHFRPSPPGRHILWSVIPIRLHASFLSGCHETNPVPVDQGFTGVQALRWRCSIRSS